MRKSLNTALPLSVLIACASPAFAEDRKQSVIESEAPAVVVGGLVAFTTENFSRGKSDTKPGVPAVIGQIEIGHDGGAYLQLSGANVTKAPPEDAASVQINYAAGYRSDFAKNASYDLSAAYSTFPGASREDGLDFDFLEFGAKADYDFGSAKPYIGLSWAPDYQYNSGPAWYVEAGAEVPIGKSFTALFRGGHATFDRNDRAGNHDYSDVSIGIGAAVSGVDVKVEYIVNDLPKNECVSSCDRVVLTMSRNF